MPWYSDVRVVSDGSSCSHTCHCHSKTRSLLLEKEALHISPVEDRPHGRCRANGNIQLSAAARLRCQVGAWLPGEQLELRERARRAFLQPRDLHQQRKRLSGWAMGRNGSSCWWGEAAVEKNELTMEREKRTRDARPGAPQTSCRWRALSVLRCSRCATGFRFLCWGSLSPVLSLASPLTAFLTET